MPIWTATQANRGALQAEIVDLQHMAESMKKAHIADIIIALCHTQEQRDDGELNCYLAKNRNGPAGKGVVVKKNFAKMLLRDSVLAAEAPPSVVTAAPKKAPGPGPSVPSVPKAKVVKRKRPQA